MGQQIGNIVTENIKTASQLQKFPNQPHKIDFHLPLSSHVTLMGNFDKTTSERVIESEEIDFVF